MADDVDDPTMLDAVGIAQAIRSRQFSAVAVVNAHLSRIDRYNPTLNAVVTLRVDDALALAAEADIALERGDAVGALHGVPFTIKDAFETAGVRTTSSSRPLEHHVPAHDAVVVPRLKSAGAILMGKSNMPELAGTLDCDSDLNGRASNP